ATSSNSRRLAERSANGVCAINSRGRSKSKSDFFKERLGNRTNAKCNGALSRKPGPAGARLVPAAGSGQNPAMDPHYPAAPWSGFLKGISIVVTLILPGVSWLAASTVPPHALPLLRTAAIALPLAILLAAIP